MHIFFFCSLLTAGNGLAVDLPFHLEAGVVLGLNDGIDMHVGSLCNGSHVLERLHEHRGLFHNFAFALRWAMCGLLGLQSLNLSVGVLE